MHKSTDSVNDFFRKVEEEASLASEEDEDTITEYVEVDEEYDPFLDDDLTFDERWYGE